MRAFTRNLVALPAAMALLTLVAGTTLAGGWAEATLTPAEGDPPVAGGERELHVTLLQHGVTPVDFGSTQITATNESTGETNTAAARSVGHGEWVATLGFPSEGSWEIVVSHSQLEISTPAQLSVGPALAVGTSWLPAAIAVGALGLMAVMGLLGTSIVRSRRGARQVEAPRIRARAEG